MKKLIILLLIAVVPLSSCASIYMKKSGTAAVSVAEALDRGDGSFPLALSSVPFVFDGEILISHTTVSRLWTGIVDGGFTIENPIITSISPVRPEDFVLFRPSWEMEVLFKNRIPRYTYKVTIDGVKGEILLLLYRNEEGGFSIMGLKAEAK